MQAVEKASKAGIIVVASAGNHGVNDERRDRLRGHHVAGQRAVGADRRRRRSQGDADARRRPHGRLQLERPDVVRRPRQAGLRRARPLPRVRSGAEQLALQDLPERSARRASRARTSCMLSGTSMSAARRQRRGGGPEAGERAADAEPCEGRAAVHRDPDARRRRRGV